MMDKTDINAMSDNAIVETVGAFVRHHRLAQNKTQAQLAVEAGVNRSTLIEFEKGMRSNIITFIQLLRSLNLLYVMEQFKITSQVSPIQLAEMDQAKRKRATKTKTKKRGKKTKSDW
jgi:putative transcriptional regulator